MSLPILNFRSMTQTHFHLLRALPIATYPLAFLLFLIQGVKSERVNPALGLIPLFFSAAYSAFLLYNQKNCGCQSSGLTGTPIHLVFDLLIGIGLLVELILTWVMLPQSDWSLTGSDIMLGTYCTNFMMLNFMIHLYFASQQLYESVLPGANYPTSCPQCQYGPFVIKNGRGAGKDYAPLLDGENPPEGYQDYQNDEAEGSGSQRPSTRSEPDLEVV